MPSVSFAAFEVGSLWSRRDLAKAWGYRGWEALARGVVTPKYHPLIILFVTAEKAAGATPYRDTLDVENGILDWEGPDDHFAEDRILAAAHSKEAIQLFWRKTRKQDFTYLGELYLERYERQTTKPSRFGFRLSRQK